MAGVDDEDDEINGVDVADDDDVWEVVEVASDDAG